MNVYFTNQHSLLNNYLVFQVSNNNLAAFLLINLCLNIQTSCVNLNVTPPQFGPRVLKLNAFLRTVNKMFVEGYLHEYSHYISVCLKDLILICIR